MHFKRVVRLSWLLGLLAALAFAVPAQAAVKGVCLVNGTAKVEDKDGSGRGVRLSGGHGNYTFKQSVFMCVGDEKGTPAIVQFNLVSEGFYDNDVCGTGKAISPWGKSRMDDPSFFSKIFGDPSKDEDFYRDMIGTLKYTVEFDDFQGQFFWHNDDDDIKPDSTIKDPTIPKTGTEDKVGWDTNPATDKDYVFAGEIDLGPPEGDPNKPAPLPDVLVNECTKAFRVSGAITLHR